MAVPYSNQTDWVRNWTFIQLGAVFPSLRAQYKPNGFCTPWAYGRRLLSLALCFAGVAHLQVRFGIMNETPIASTKAHRRQIVKNWGWSYDTFRYVVVYYVVKLQSLMLGWMSKLTVNGSIGETDRNFHMQRFSGQLQLDIERNFKTLLHSCTDSTQVWKDWKLPCTPLKCV